MCSIGDRPGTVLRNISVEYLYGLKNYTVANM